MKKNKKFDCVQMKWEIQKKIEEEFKGLTFEQRRQKTHEIIMADPILARMWREAKPSQYQTQATEKEAV